MSEKDGVIWRGRLREGVVNPAVLVLSPLKDGDGQIIFDDRVAIPRGCKGVRHVSLAVDREREQYEQVLRSEGEAALRARIVAGLRAEAAALSESDSHASGIEWAVLRDLATRLEFGLWPGEVGAGRSEP